MSEIYKLVDTISRKEQTYDHEPTVAEMEAFKRLMGYTSAKISRIDDEGETKIIYITPRDVAGF